VPPLRARDLRQLRWLHQKVERSRQKDGSARLRSLTVGGKWKCFRLREEVGAAISNGACLPHQEPHGPTWPEDAFVEIIGERG